MPHLVLMATDNVQQAAMRYEAAKDTFTIAFYMAQGHAAPTASEFEGLIKQIKDSGLDDKVLDSLLMAGGHGLYEGGQQGNLTLTQLNTVVDTIKDMNIRSKFIGLEHCCAVPAMLATSSLLAPDGVSYGSISTGRSNFIREALADTQDFSTVVDGIKQQFTGDDQALYAKMSYQDHQLELSLPTTRDLIERTIHQVFISMLSPNLPEIEYNQIEPMLREAIGKMDGELQTRSAQFAVVITEYLYSLQTDSSNQWAGLKAKAQEFIETFNKRLTTDVFEDLVKELDSPGNDDQADLVKFLNECYQAAAPDVADVTWPSSLAGYAHVNAEVLDALADIESVHTEAAEFNVEHSVSVDEEVDDMALLQPAADGNVAKAQASAQAEEAAVAIKYR